MGKPEVIMHNSISLDGRITGFDADLGLHYRIVGEYEAEIYLIGSNTALTGAESASPETPPETAEDFRKPERGKTLSYWVIPDTRGRLRGKLHVLRRFEYCRDIIVLVSRATDRGYVAWLDERGYDHIDCGEDHADYEAAFGILAEKYGAGKILVDSGPVLGGVLLGRGLVDEISLLVHPVLAGRKARSLFENIDPDYPGTGLDPVRNENLGNGCLWSVWKVVRRASGEVSPFPR
jgi:2,5-diamino-6-(ribosylamino)-4(3H)-pyrimidinone 5'-phosphate reductase